MTEDGAFVALPGRQRLREIAPEYNRAFAANRTRRMKAASTRHRAKRRIEPYIAQSCTVKGGS